MARALEMALALPSNRGFQIIRVSRQCGTGPSAIYTRVSRDGPLINLRFSAAQGHLRCVCTNSDIPASGVLNWIMQLIFALAEGCCPPVTRSTYLQRRR